MEYSEMINSPNKMMVYTTGRVDVVNIDQLIRIEAQSNYSKLFFANGKTLMVAKVLRKFEEQLSQEVFIRAHKTHLVNVHFIRSYEGKDQKMLILHNGDNIIVARRKHRCVLESLMSLQAV